MGIQILYKQQQYDLDPENIRISVGDVFEWGIAPILIPSGRAGGA